MVCGLPPPLSAMETVALLLPIALGLNFSVIVQLLAAPTDEPQLLLWLKSPGFVPPRVTPVMLKAAVPTLVKVTVLAALVTPTLVRGKATLAADNVTCVPTPVRLMVCGLPPPLSVMVTLPERVPTTVGVKVTEIVHLAPARTVLPQVLVSLKSPLAAMLVMLRVVVPVLVSVTVWAALVVWRSCVANVRLVLDSCTFGPPTAAFTATVSIAKSVQVVAQVVRLTTAEVIFGPV